MADERFLEGVDIFVNGLPTDGANVDVATRWKCYIFLMSMPNQLRMMLHSTLL